MVESASVITHAPVPWSDMGITDQEFLQIYLTAKQQPASPPGVQPQPRHVSTFWAGLQNSRGTAGRDLDSGRVVSAEHSASWLAAIGYLCWFDQVGTAIVLDGKLNPGSSFLGALDRFSDLDEREREALYALRSSLAHDFSLINSKVASPRNPLRWHCFQLDPFDHPIFFPPTPWDGVTYPPPETVVGLMWISDLAERVKAGVLQCWRDGRLSPGDAPGVALARFSFGYVA